MSSKNKIKEFREKINSIDNRKIGIDSNPVTDTLRKYYKKLL